MQKTKGVTLIELMLALTMSMMGLSIIITIFIAAQKSYLIQSDLSHIQETARTVTALFTSVIQRAGYIGCARLTEVFPLANSTPYEINSKNKMVIEKGNEITIRNASVLHANLIENMQSLSEIETTSSPHFSVGDVLLVSDCQSADIFQVDKILPYKNHQIIIPKYPLMNKYKNNSEVSFLEINTYFVDKTKRKSLSGKPIYALYSRDIHNQKTEWVDGIDQMQMQFDYFNEVRVGVDATFSFSSVNLKKQWNSYIHIRDKA